MPCPFATGSSPARIFAGLNCGAGSSDLSEVVQINRARVAEALGLAPTALVSLHQVHSADVVHLTGSLKSPVKADGMVTATPGLALGILTADCQPVLFSDPVAGVIGAAHAGWRGAQSGVLEAVVAAMVQLGSKPQDIRAVIGPRSAPRPATSRPTASAGTTAASQTPVWTS